MRTMLVAGAAVVLIGIIWLFARGSKQKAAAPVAEPQPQTASQPTVAAIPAEPALAAVKLSADTGSGKVSFDDGAPGDLQDAQWAVDKIGPGDHAIKFTGPAGGASFKFSAAAGTLPAVKGPISAKGLLAVVVASMGDHIHVYASDSTAKLVLDGQSPLSFSNEGADLSSVTPASVTPASVTPASVTPASVTAASVTPASVTAASVTPGAHELTLIHGSDQYKLPIEVAAVPSLAVFLESGQNVGSLVVLSGQDKAKVFLNGKALPQSTRNGQLRIPNLEPKEYSVRVSKNGFEEVPEQKIKIRKGEQARLTFNLQPTAHMASLSIHGAPPGATVMLDQTSAGTVQPDGSFNFSSVAPGDHVVELRKDRFKPRQIKKHFAAGAQVALVSADVALEAAPAELKITFSPADAQVSLTKANEAPVKVVSGAATSLPGGSYTLSVHNADNFTRSGTVEVAPGQSRSMDLQLAPSGMSKFDDASEWKQDKGAFTRKGGDFVLYGVSPTSGTFIFSAMLNKGHRMQWVLNYSDSNNYDLFQIDDNNFYRTVIRNGQKTNDMKLPHKSEKKSIRTLQIRVSAGEIIHQIKQGDGWVVLDRWTEPGINLASGKFGFYLPGGDQISLSSFSHYSDLNLH
ncbi:MAG TPA: PEGA domain-containing protein [Candidatus Sulfotelmatobacter sp.]